MPKNAKRKSPEKNPSFRSPKKASLARALTGAETETEVPLPVIDTIVNVTQQMQAQDEEDGSDDSVDAEDDGDKELYEDHSLSDDEVSGEYSEESERSLSSVEQQEEPHDRNENDEITKINASIVEIEAKIREIDAEIANVRTDVNDAKAALRAFNQDNIAIEEVFERFTLTKDWISPNQEREDQVERLRKYLELSLQSFNNLRATEAGLINLLVEKQKSLAEEKAKLSPQNPIVTLQSPGHHRVVREALSIKSNPKMYLEELNKMFLKSFQTTLDERIINIPRDWSSNILCEGTMNLAFLNPLRLPGKEDVFLPKKIFVRDCMKSVFKVFCDDAINTKKEAGSFRTVLIGSPGVGKSILFFLAALYQAQYSYVLYYRRTTIEGLVSLFIMVPNEEGSVRVWFTRNVLKFRSQGSVSHVQTKILDFNSQRDGDLRFDNAYTYVDGPRHTDKRNTLEGSCDYFCTSGGHPLPKPEGLSTFRFLVLSGWSKEEAVEGLYEAYKIPKSKAASLYELCGGSVREMLRAFADYGKVKAEFDALLGRLSGKQIAIAVQSTERNDNEKSYDRIRIMFEVTGHPTPVQRVDSTYVLNNLCRKIPLKKWFSAYRLGVGIGDGTLQGVTFERCIHVWFFREKPKPIARVCWSQGTSRDGIGQLDSANVYWIPSIPNFPNIDSAVVIDGELYALQITCKKKEKSFDTKQFWKNFVEVVQGILTIQFTKVNVIYVVPIGSQLPPIQHPKILGSVHHIDTTTLNTFEQSLWSLPFLARRR